MTRGVSLLSLILLGGFVLAIDYQVNGEGGPPGLADAVAAAFSSWQSVEGAEVEAEVRAEAANRVRYGGGDNFGPETYSLTVQRTEEDTRRIVVLLNPTLEPESDLRRRALLHETGILLGLGEAEDGVMNPAFPEGAAANLSEADRIAIRNLESFEVEDINRDGVVDFYDLAEFAESFRQSGVGLDADVNDDGVVDEDDLERLREAYVFGAPSEIPPGDGDETGGATGGVTGGETPDEFEDDLEDDDDGIEFGDEVTGGSGTGGAALDEATGGGTGGSFEEDE